MSVKDKFKDFIVQCSFSETKYLLAIISKDKETLLRVAETSLCRTEQTTVNYSMDSHGDEMFPGIVKTKIQRQDLMSAVGETQ